MRIEAVICAWDHPDGAAFYVRVLMPNARMERKYFVPSSIARAEINAMRFVLAAIPISGTHIKVITDSYYVAGLLERDANGWVKPVRANADLVNNMRDSISRHQFEVMRSTHPEIENCRLPG